MTKDISIIVVIVFSVQLLHSFKIHVHEDPSVVRLQSPLQGIVRQAVKDAVNYWSRTLDARRSSGGPLLLDRQCRGAGIWTGLGCPRDQGCAALTKCGEVTVPESHLAACLLCDNGSCDQDGTQGPGVTGADLILYVSSVTSSSLCQEQATLSHAGHCQQDPDTDRPTAGHINICTNNISDQQELTDNIKHELLHVLGFSVKLFAFFRDRKGNPRTKRDRRGRPPLHSKYYLHVADNTTVARVERRDWQVAGGVVTKTMHMLVTPRVRREAKRHFSCRTLEGGELEDQGDYGTALTHWEKRVFGDEAMTGNHQELEVRGKVFKERKLISRMTLAVLHDSGWYNVDFRKANPDYSWGKGLGCDFVKKSCLHFMRNKPKIRPFCDSRTKVETPRSLRRAGRAGQQCEQLEFCNLLKYDKPLPGKYQNLDSVDGDNKDLSYFGAGMWLADFCPTLVRFQHCS